jgi:hypothetical protein
MLYVAIPLLTVPVPSAVLPSLNVTVPVVVVGFTVAVKVTKEPYTEGVTDETSAAVLFALLTVCVNTEDELPL